MTERIEIVLDPALGISAEQFAEAWDTSEACRAAGSAELVTVRPKDFSTELLTTLFITGIVGVGFTGLNEAIKIALKNLSEAKKKKAPAGETLFIPANAGIERHKGADGSERLVITIPAPAPPASAPPASAPAQG